MGRKQYQSQGRYAKTGSQARKKRPQKSGTQESTFSASSQESVDWNNPESTPRPAPMAGGRYAQPAASYPYLASDLMHTAIIAVIAFIILIILYVVL